MKTKSLKLIAVALVVICFVAGAVACSKKVTLSFNSQGGSAVASITLDKGADVKAPEDPEKEGFRFDGWFEDAQCTGTAYIFSKMPSKNLMLYAKWTAIVTVSFETNGGNSIVSMVGVPGETLAAPTEPTRANYRFLGWYATSGFDGTVYEFSTYPDANLKLYAKWVEVCTVNFYILDGQAAYNTTAVDRGSKVSAPATAPSRLGYTFLGWVSDSSGEGTVIDFTNGQSIVKNTAYYAKWDAAQSTLNFDLRGGNISGSTTVTPITALTGDPISSLLPATPVKENCIFGGWYIDAALTTKIGGVMPAGINTVYANWLIESTSMYVNLLADAFSSVVEGLTIVNNDKINNLKVGIDSTKIAWSCVGTNLIGKFEGYTRIDLTLKGTSGKRVMFKLEGGKNALEHFVTMTGDVQTSTMVVDANNLPSKDTGVLKFLVFLCPDDAAAAGAEVEITKATMVKYLLENSDEQGAVVFHAMKDTLKTVYTFKKGDTIVFPDLGFINPGYHAEKYYTDYALTQEFTDTVMPSGPVHLYVQWAVNDPGSITLKYENGDDDYEMDDPIGANLTWVNPTYPGYTFDGWYYLNGTKADIRTMPSEAVTLYAHWTLNATKTITFVTNGGNTIDNLVLPQGAELEMPLPTRVGYEFLGWFNDAEFTNEFVLFYMPSKDTTVYAKWIGNVDYTLNYDAQGGTVNPVSVTVRSLEKLINIPTPTHTNTAYFFGGWYNESTYATPFKGTMGDLTGNVTVYAKWLELESNTKDAIGLTGFTSSNSSRLTITTNTTFKNAHATHSYYIYKDITWNAEKEFLVFRVTGNAAFIFRVQLYVGSTQVGGNYDVNTVASTSVALSIFKANIPAGTTVQVRMLVNPTGSQTTTQVTLTEMAFYHGKVAGTADGSAIYYNANATGTGVKSIASTYAAIGATITQPVEVPVRPGYEFGGWYTDAACETAYEFNTMPATSVTVYAKWNANADVTVTFSISGGTLEQATFTAPAGSYITSMPGATPDDTSVSAQFNVANKKFGAWYYDSAFTQPFTGYMPTENVTLYGRWSVLGNAYDLRSLLVAVGPTTITRDAEGVVTYTMTANEGGWPNSVIYLPIDRSLHYGLILSGKVSCENPNSGFLVKPLDNNAYQTWLQSSDPSETITSYLSFSGKADLTGSLKTFLFAGPNGGSEGDTFTIQEFYLVGYVLE